MGDSTWGSGELCASLSSGSSAYHVVASVGLPAGLAGSASALSGLTAWRQFHFNVADSTGDAADSADPDHDGIPNLVEYAFGLDPAANSSGQLPVAKKLGDVFVLDFTEPAGVSGLVYGAEWSPDLKPGSWTPVADTGSGVHHVFQVPSSDSPTVFMRLKVELPDTTR